jgi:hypothetical protein
MDADEEPPFPDADRLPRGEASRVPPSTWVGVAVIGAILFALGIWTPAWRGIPGGTNGLNLVAAAGGAVLLIVGVTLGWRGRDAGHSTPIDEMAGVEVFRPPPPSRVRVAEPTVDEDER